VRVQAAVWRVPSRQNQALRPAAFTTQRTEKASHNGKKPENGDSDDVLTAQKIALEGIRRERHRDGKGTGLEPQQLVHEDDVNEEHIHPTWDEERCPVHHPSDLHGHCHIRQSLPSLRGATLLYALSGP
jgi:hypothetical protein